MTYRMQIHRLKNIVEKNFIKNSDLKSWLVIEKLRIALSRVFISFERLLTPSSMMHVLYGVELETLVSEPDALTTRPPPCASFEAIRLKVIKKDRQNGEHRKGREFIKGAEL